MDEAMSEASIRLAEWFESHRRDYVVVVTGAGISHASGIPTFRGSDTEAIWKVSDVEMATFAFFQSDPVTQWRWYLDRFKTLQGAQPNAAHRALADYEAWQQSEGRFSLVTQNIDTLHEEAGSRSMIKVHGTSDRLRCVRSGCDLAEPRGSIDRAEIELAAFTQKPDPENLPRCPECGELLRAHVLFFDEYYHSHVDYRFDEVEKAAHEADFVLFIGTSFSVGVTDLFVRAAALDGTPSCAIDPARLASTAALSPGVEHIQGVAEEILPSAVDGVVNNTGGKQRFKER